LRLADGIDSKRHWPASGLGDDEPASLIVHLLEAQPVPEIHDRQELSVEIDDARHRGRGFGHGRDRSLWHHSPDCRLVHDELEWSDVDGDQPERTGPLDRTRRWARLPGPTHLAGRQGGRVLVIDRQPGSCQPGHHGPCSLQVEHVQPDAPIASYPPSADDSAVAE